MSDTVTDNNTTTTQRSYKRRRYNEAALLGTARQLNSVGYNVRLFSGCIGLMNLGNTCFINSAIQALAYCDKFREQYVIYDYSDSDSDSDSGCDNSNNQQHNTDRSLLLKRTNSSIRRQHNNHNNTTITTALIDLYQTLWHYKPVDPVHQPLDFIYTIRSLYPRFADLRQHDTHEFITFLLQQLSKEQQNHNNDNINTTIDSLFGCTIVTHITCQKQHTTITETNSYHVLSIHLPPINTNKTLNKTQSNNQLLGGYSATSNGINDHSNTQQTTTTSTRTSTRRNAYNHNQTTYTHQLYDCLDYNFLHSEPLDVKFKCNKCKKPVDATRQTCITKLSSQYLILHITRTIFDTHNKTTRKDQSHVSCPLDNLDMTKYIYNNDTHQQYIYDLYGVVVHHGYSVNEGHYITYVYSEWQDSWLVINDASVSIADENDVKNAQPYLLFYARRDNDDNDNNDNNDPVKKPANTNKSESNQSTKSTRQSPRLMSRNNCTKSTNK